MKILGTGDWHITKKAPENRLDNYWDTAMGKIGFIITQAIKHKVRIIAQPGDMFDNASVPFDVVGRLMRALRVGCTSGIGVISVEGQHDVRFHNLQNLNNPHYLMTSSGTISSPNKERDTVKGNCRIDMIQEGEKPVSIYGASWGEDLPEITTPDNFNILITHRMIIKDRKGKLWNGQEDYELSTSILKTTGFDIVISGDNHQAFIGKSGEQLLFNCGSLLRNRIDQASHRPYIVIFDTESPQDYKKIYVPILPLEEVMDMEKREKNDIRDEKLNLFIEYLQKTKAAQLDYKENVWKLMKKGEVSPGTKTILQSIFS